MDGGAAAAAPSIPAAPVAVAEIGGRSSIGGHGIITEKAPAPLVGKKSEFERVPTNGNSNLPTNETAVSTNRKKVDRPVKRGWIEWSSRMTKQYGKRRYPRYREWLWDGEKQEWVKSNPVYRDDLEPMDESNYVKYAERRDKARKLGY